MTAREAAFFYGDYRDLMQEFKELELSDNSPNPNTHDEKSDIESAS
jgi:hypothetical protein